MKTFLRKCLVLIAMLAPLCGVSAQTVVTFNATTDKATPSGKELSKDGITLTVGNGDLGNGTDYRCYKGQTLTVKAVEGQITKIDINCTTKGTAQYGPGNFTLSGNGDNGTYTFEQNGQNGTWTHPTGLHEVLMTASANQVRMNTIVVTLAPTGDPNKKNTKLTFKQETYNFNVGTGDQVFDNIPVLTEDGIDTPPIKGVITYKSSNQNIAIVEDGTVMVDTKAAGTATITAEYAGDDTYNGCKAEYTINVNKVATSIAFDKGDVTYTVGDENNAAVYENPAILDPASAGTVTYKSSDEAAATVDKTGAVLVDTSKPGKYTITASFAGNDSYEASSASYTITVEKVFYSGAENYVKIDSNDDLAGKYVMIGHANASKNRPTAEDYILTEIIDKNKYYNAVKLTLNGDQICAIPEAAKNYAVFTFEKYDSDQYLIYNITTSKYIKNTDADNNAQITEVEQTNNEEGTHAKITFDDTNRNQSFEFDAPYTKKNINFLQFNANFGQERFTTYASTQQSPQLFRHGYARDVTSGNFGTLCLPYGGTISGATLYAIEGKQMENGEVKSISLTEVEKAEAGVPYIFQATAEKFVVYYEGDIQTTAGNDNGLIGSYNGTAVKAGNYVISGNTVKKCGDGSKIGTNRCYINMDQVHEADASAAALVISFNDTTDAIESIEAGADSRNAIYDLSGRRVKAAKKGLYIVNGKKIIK